jgi:hypothetical protein
MLLLAQAFHRIRSSRSTLATLLLLVSIGVFGTMLFPRLSHPLLWHDEGETAMFGTRILEYGYPKVHGERNVVYVGGMNVGLGVKEHLDAYIGTTWGHFYFAVPGLLWARGADDPHTRTWRLRLPFALAGALGVAVMLGAVLPAHRGARHRARLFAALFFLLTAVSISLLLHLREARYYALVVLVTAAILHVHLRRAVFQTLGLRSYAVQLTVLLVILFNVFFSGYFTVVALLAIERLAAAWRAPRAGERRDAIRDLAPLVASALCVVPLMNFYETLRIAGAFAEERGLSAAVYASNLRMVLGHFLRHELLAPALVCRAVRLGVEWRSRRGGVAIGLDENRRGAHFLAFFAAGYAAIGCANPQIYERYFAVLSPIVTLVFLLDAFALAQGIPKLAESSRRGRVRVAALAGLLALGIGAVMLRGGEVSGRIEEVRHANCGPLDLVVRYLMERYPDPRALVIATNYEALPLMYYLGSQVIVGAGRTNLPEDRKREPDVVIPRLWWRQGLGELRRFLERGEFEAVTLPIPDLPYNSMSALSPWPSIPVTHRFRTPQLRDPERGLVIYERVERADEPEQTRKGAPQESPRQ